MKEPLFGIGDLVVYNPKGNFGNKDDFLFHIHDYRFGVCRGISKKQYWYAGYMLGIDDYASEGLPEVPVFRTTITNVSESNLQELKHLRIKFDIYKSRGIVRRIFKWR